MSKRGPVLGIDFGARRIGLAVSDPDRIFAFPAGHLARSGKERDLAALRQLADEREVVQIVVGLPIHMNGREGPEARVARAFAEDLRRETGRSVDLLDERWTSREAERSLRDQGQSARRARQHVDEVAASIILRTYLELKRSELGRTEAPVAQAGVPQQKGDLD
jgi:putative Holliday junction resolvase